ncbi:MAG: thiamine phosphate synthase, partial [Pelagibacteraceae bacterium]
LNQLKNINIIYRNYQKTDYLSNAFKLQDYCKKRNFKLYISNDERLAIKLRSYGLYIPSFNNKKKYLKSSLHLIGSAHNEIELRKKISQGCKEIFISPIFNTYSGSNKIGKGLNFYQNLMLKFSKIHIHALGGINEKNIKKIILLKGRGFSSISMIDKKMKKDFISYLNLIATNL